MKKLKQIDNTNFTTEFITFSTVKEWEIQNSIHAINFNWNNFIIIKNDDVEICYEAKKNEKKLQYYEYEIINSNCNCNCNCNSYILVTLI